MLPGYATPVLGVKVENGRVKKGVGGLDGGGARMRDRNCVIAELMRLFWALREFLLCLNLDESAPASLIFAQPLREHQHLDCCLMNGNQGGPKFTCPSNHPSCICVCESSRQCYLFIPGAD
jgi:hypothetical protein